MKDHSKKRARLLSGTLIIAMLLGGCAKSSAPSSVKLKNDPDIKTEIDLKKIKDTGFSEDVMDSGYISFSIGLMGSVAENDGSDSNIMVSPASIMLAFDMLAAGAKGDSLRQITDLFAEGQEALKQQAYAAAMMDKINGSKGVDLSCVNAVWNNSAILGNKVNMEYVDYIKETYLAEYVVTDFDEKTPGQINSWVKSKTDNMIPKVIDSIDPYAVMVLVNAIAFDGKWAVVYDSVDHGDFTASDGSVQNAAYLCEDSSIYYESGKATGFSKAYEGGEYSFVAILPKDTTVSANEFIKELTAEDYMEFMNSATGRYEVHSKIPRFTSDYDCLLNDAIIDLGAGDIFSTDKADFSGIALKPGDICLSRVIHKTHIEVDEKGTKAAAVTLMEPTMACDSVTEIREVYCDRPFVYAIVDNRTNLPLFIGTLNSV